jgi:GNAT superfamily N-acetyltransferase
MKAQMEIIRAQAEDAQTLTSIALAAKRYWGYPENWMVHWQQLLTISAEYIQHHKAFKALKNDQIIGFYILTSTPEQLDLQHMWVHPDEIGHGVGRALMEHAIRQAAHSELEIMEIEADPNAEGFYLKMGARHVGARIYKLEGQQRTLPLLQLHIPAALKNLENPDPSARPD